MFHWLADPKITNTIGIWLAALGTLALYSVLYKENPIYRFAEHVFIGAAAGYSIYMTWAQVLKPQWFDLIASGQWYWVFVPVVGGMFYFTFSRKHSWISKLVFGALLGLTSGMAFKGFAGMNMDQISASFKPLYVRGDIGSSFNNVIFIFVLLTVMAYFFFSFEHKSKVQRTPASIGRWVLMFAFGAMFGATVMARMSLLIGRVYFLLHDWMHLAR